MGVWDHFKSDMSKVSESDWSIVPDLGDAEPLYPDPWHVDFYYNKKSHKIKANVYMDSITRPFYTAVNSDYHEILNELLSFRPNWEHSGYLHRQAEHANQLLKADNDIDISYGTEDTNLSKYLFDTYYAIIGHPSQNSP